MAICQKENEDLKELNLVLKNETQKCQQQAIKEVSIYQVQALGWQKEAEQFQKEAEQLQKQIEQLQKEAEQCKINQFEDIEIHTIGDIFISTIRTVDNARELDLCLGTSTDIGYFTSRSCCYQDEISLFDIETNAEIFFEENSIFMTEHICLINTTSIEKAKFPQFDQLDNQNQNCSVSAFNESEGQFYDHELDIDINDCFLSPCQLTIGANFQQNATVLNGASLKCDQSKHFGIISNGEFLAPFGVNNIFRVSEQNRNDNDFRN